MLGPTVPVSTTLRNLRYLASHVIVGGVLAVGAVRAQQTDVKQAYATRAELEASLVELEKVIASPGYSQRLRDAKMREVELVRRRLKEGDFQVGDEIFINVLNEAQFTDTFTVTAERTLVLPGVSPIALQGVLRAEAEFYLSEQLKKVVVDPTVKVVPMIRLSILGKVGRPGFYHMAADLPVSEVIMQAGGPAGLTDPARSTVRRAGVEILSRDDMQIALREGTTLDQLNLQAGDELVVEYVGKPPFGIKNVMAIVGVTSTMLFIIWRVNRVF